MGIVVEHVLVNVIQCVLKTDAKVVAEELVQEDVNHQVNKNNSLFYRRSPKCHKESRDNFNFQCMTSRKEKEKLQSRREFFKQAAKKTLPVIGAIVLTNSPVIAQAASTAPMGCMDNTCSGGCKGNCVGKCFGGCTSCSGTCKGGCHSSSD